MKKLIMVSLITLSFTSCIPLAVASGAAVGAAAGVGGAMVANKMINEKKPISSYSSDVKEVIK